MIKLLAEMDYTYDGKFEGNILVVGRTGCRKTTFVQNLGKNRMFGNVKEVIWGSKIILSKEGEEQITSCFVDQKIYFSYVKNIDEFDDLLESIHEETPYWDKDKLGENIELDHLIVFDDVSGLANKLETFANFLAVSRKYGLTCVYVFHTLYPTRQNWQMILAQTKIFNIFPGSVQTNLIFRILSSFCSRFKFAILIEIKKIKHLILF